jgi:hypothetical protein
MRYTLSMLFAVAAAAPLQAQWTTDQIYTGTPTDIPVGVAVRAFGGAFSHDAVLLVERRNGPNDPATEHFNTLLRQRCQNAACTLFSSDPPVQVPPADQAVPVGLANDQYYNGSLALHSSPAFWVPPFPLPPIHFPRLDAAHVVRRNGPTAGCATTELDLTEEALDLDTLVWSQQTVSANSVGQCEDRQLSYTQRSGETLHTCWTQDPTAALNDNQVWCGSRPLSSSWSSALLADGLDDQDHMSFVVDPTTDWRYVVHRDRDAAPDTVALRVPEAGTVGSLVAAPADQLDYPSIVRAPDNSYHAGWHFPKNTGGKIQYSSCPATSDCTDVANWVAPVQIRMANGARHAELAASADGKLMLAWMETDADGDRVHFKETCAGNAWPPGAGEVPRVTVNSVFQSTFIGRPHLTIDDWSDLVHLAFVEFDSKTNPTSGNVFWSRKNFVACP